MTSSCLTSNCRFRQIRLVPVPYIITIALAAVVSGCGEDGGHGTNARNFAASSPQGAAVSSDGFSGESKSLQLVAGQKAAPRTAAKPQSPPDAAAEPPARTTRKIIYNGRIELKVESLASTQQSVFRLIDEFGAFLSDSDQSSLNAAQPHASWKVRVPVERFHSLVAAVIRLGEVRVNQVASQDVTEEFFDVEARIHNKQEEERRLLKILVDATGRLKDILEIERELSRVREEVERMQGRLRLLASQAELSTLTIDATEWKEYKPPIAPTFMTQMQRNFFGSIENLTGFGAAVLLFLAAIVPWLPLIAVVAVLVRWFIRWGVVPTNSRVRPADSPTPIV